MSNNKLMPQAYLMNQEKLLEKNMDKSSVSISVFTNDMNNKLNITVIFITYTTMQNKIAYTLISRIC